MGSFFDADSTSFKLPTSSPPLMSSLNVYSPSGMGGINVEDDDFARGIWSSATGGLDGGVGADLASWISPRGFRPPSTTSRRASMLSQLNNNIGGDDDLNTTSEESIEQACREAQRFGVIRLFVHNLPTGTTWQDLKSYFSRFGNPQYAFIYTNQETGVNLAYGYVVMSRVAETLAVLRHGRPHYINGQRGMIVQLFRSAKGLYSNGFWTSPPVDDRVGQDDGGDFGEINANLINNNSFQACNLPNNFNKFSSRAGGGRNQSVIGFNNGINGGVGGGGGGFRNNNNNMQQTRQPHHQRSQQHHQNNNSNTILSPKIPNEDFNFDMSHEKFEKLKDKDAKKRPSVSTPTATTPSKKPGEPSSASASSSFFDTFEQGPPFGSRNNRNNTSRPPSFAPVARERTLSEMSYEDMMKGHEQLPPFGSRNNRTTTTSRPSPFAPATTSFIMSAESADNIMKSMISTSPAAGEEEEVAKLLTVSNLALDTLSKDISQCLEQFGPVKSVALDFKDAPSSLTASVEMEHKDDAVKVLSYEGSLFIKGRAVSVVASDAAANGRKSAETDAGINGFSVISDDDAVIITKQHQQQQGANGSTFGW